MNYKKIFLHNNYEIEKEFTFTLNAFDEVKNHKIFKREFAIITAFNPFTKKLTNEENQKRNKILATEIKTSGYEYLLARGFLEEHSEDGFLIFDISFEKAISFALTYEQYAIFYNNSKKIGYYESENKIVIVEKLKN